ncbi:MAG: hypothetical protein HY962_04210 [Ignavibacteriae bacterium]|nr:hypothetical protein [Ignavibacteriota bacterium]
MKSKLLIIGVLTPILLMGLSPGASAQTHIIAQESMDASGWFGGDNRPNSRRTVGVGQLVLMDTAMTVRSFSFHFSSPFDFAQNSSGSGHDVTLRLHVRNRAGVVLKTSDVFVPASFTSGWITWEGLGLTVTSGIKLFFTAYVVGGFDSNSLYSSYSAAATDPYPGGTVMLKDGQSDADLDSWNDWVPNSGWDAAFRLTGTIITTSADHAAATHSDGIRFTHTYPTPVHTDAHVEFFNEDNGAVTLELYDLAGLRVRTLVSGELTAGTHRVQWTVDGLPSGLYPMLLRSGRTSRTRLISIVR